MPEATLVPYRGYEEDKKNENIIYISDLSILPEYQDTDAFLKLFLKFKKALKNTDYQKVACHTETEGGVREYPEGKRNLSQSMQEIGFKVIKQEPHWCGGDECYDYLVLDIDSKDSHNRQRPLDESI